MLIYAENSHVIFECEICGFKLQVPTTAKKNRTFMRHFNGFKRDHEWACRIKKDKNDRIDFAEKTTTDILAKLQAVQ